MYYSASPPTPPSTSLLIFFLLLFNFFPISFSFSLFVYLFIEIYSIIKSSSCTPFYSKCVTCLFFSFLSLSLFLSFSPLSPSQIFLFRFLLSFSILFCFSSCIKYLSFSITYLSLSLPVLFWIFGDFFLQKGTTPFPLLKMPFASLSLLLSIDQVALIMTHCCDATIITFFQRAAHRLTLFNQ